MSWNSPLLFCLALAGCAGPGTGWDRASDLSVYASAHAYARIALEQQVLCGGDSPEDARAGFERQFAGRNAVVRAALVARHGEAALDRASRHFVKRVSCGDVPDFQWGHRYEDLLRLLENRLEIMPERGG
ncbi:MAG TPA: hypothetical protein VEW04_07595 [Allosphingosinicella sp.]|nr:hypothetical protein [Allosphingosinicella sp.]